jgi:histidyl-tRNA synthetase
MGAPAVEHGLLLGRELRTRGVPVEVDGRGGSLKSMLRRANGSGARFCILIGDSEIARGVVTVKDLAGHSQEELARGTAVEAIVGKIAEPTPERREGSS